MKDCCISNLSFTFNELSLNILWDTNTALYLLVTSKLLGDNKKFVLNLIDILLRDFKVKKRIPPNTKNHQLFNCWFNVFCSLNYARHRKQRCITHATFLRQYEMEEFTSTTEAKYWCHPAIGE